MAHSDEKNTFLSKMTSFWGNFWKNATKQQKSLMYLFMAHFAEKNFFDENEMVLPLSVEMLQNYRSA